MKTKKNVLSQADLREIYIREGWIDGINVGRLRHWLESQADAVEPDQPGWRKVYRETLLSNAIHQEVAKRSWGRVLRDVAEPFNNPGEFGDYIQLLPEPLRWFAERLDSCVQAFRIIDRDRMAYIDHLNEVRVVHRVSDEATIHEATASDVLAAALTSWSRGSVAAGRSKSACCNWMDSVLDELMARAGAEFDASVAVSADGRHVLVVDHVMIYSRNAYRRRFDFRSYRPAAFQTRKIRLGALHVLRPPMPNKKWTEDELFAWVQKNLAKKTVQEGIIQNQRQILIQVGLIKILYIDKASIPDELRGLLASTAPAPPEGLGETIQAPPPDPELDLRAPTPPPAAHAPTLPSPVYPSLSPDQNPHLAPLPACNPIEAGGEPHPESQDAGSSSTRPPSKIP